MKKRILEKRAEDLKTLIEKRADFHEEMTALLEAAKKETRAMSKEEAEEFDAIENKIKEIDGTIDREKRSREITITQTAKKEGGKEEQKTIDERAFDAHIRNIATMRAGEQNLTKGDNGAIIPTTIANRIISEVKDICPILQKSTLYTAKGTLKIPVWGKANGHDITVGYQEEFTELTADAGKFTSVDLTGYLSGALSLIGISVVNNAQIDVVSFIVREMANKIAQWIEGELLNGSGSFGATGVLTTTTTVVSASATALTSDELIDLQAKVKQVYQKNALWIMHPDTYTSIKKLKDANNVYLLQDDFTNEFPYRLLGKPVYLSDNMPAMAAGKSPVLYGDLSGMAVKFSENIQIQILIEKYATMHAMGVVAWFEFDAKPVDMQKLARIEMKTTGA